MSAAPTNGYSSPSENGQSGSAVATMLQADAVLIVVADPVTSHPVTLEVDVLQLAEMAPLSAIVHDTNLFVTTLDEAHDDDDGAEEWPEVEEVDPVECLVMVGSDDGRGVGSPSLPIVIVGQLGTGGGTGGG